jgi:hypothetical protein
MKIKFKPSRSTSTRERFSDVRVVRPNTEFNQQPGVKSGGGGKLVQLSSPALGAINFNLGSVRAIASCFPEYPLG